MELRTGEVAKTMKRKPIEVVIGWKTNFGWLDYAAQAWVSSPKPKRRLLHVDLGWTAFGSFEKAMSRNRLPFNKVAILANIGHGAHDRLYEAWRVASLYALPWRTP